MLLRTITTLLMLELVLQSTGGNHVMVEQLTSEKHFHKSDPKKFGYSISREPKTWKYGYSKVVRADDVQSYGAGVYCK